MFFKEKELRLRLFCNAIFMVCCFVKSFFSKSCPEFEFSNKKEIRISQRQHSEQIMDKERWQRHPRWRASSSRGPRRRWSSSQGSLRPPAQLHIVEQVAIVLQLKMNFVKSRCPKNVLFLSIDRKNILSKTFLLTQSMRYTRSHWNW